ncbi:MAG TPA: serine/threonine-protein kinase [Trebonia sp.]
MELEGPGRLLAGRYRLGPVIGRGGMGVVWQAQDELLGREVAVKELIWPASFSAREQEAACRRAVREAKAAARLTHRNVIRVFDTLEEDGRPWIVMELLPPNSLRDVVDQQGPLSPVRAARLGLEILAALRAAHALGVVHRDVKPANILVTPERAVLIDFGIAQAAETSSGATTASMLIGSPAYIAPERARGGLSGPPADLWGLGASLYAAVEGSGPFEREAGALASLAAVIAYDPEPAPHAGPLLGPVISGLLRKDPDERLDAAEAERLLRLVVVPVSPAIAVGRGRRRKTAAAAFVGAAVLVTSGVLTAGALGHPSPPRPSASAAAAPPAAARPSGTAATAPPSTTSPRHPAAGPTPKTAAGTHLAARTSPTSQAPPKPAAGPPGLGNPPGPGGPKPKPKPPKPPKPGKGNGKGNGKGK